MFFVIMLLPFALGAYSIETLIKNANKGETSSQRWLGLAYIKGDEIEKDIDKGIFWLKKSAESASKKESEAAFDLGKIYYEGELVPQDLKQAFKYYKQSAEALDFEAMEIISDMYLKGEGTERDIEMAYYWLIAASGFDLDASGLAEELAEKFNLDEETIERLQSEAYEYVSEYYMEVFGDLLYFPDYDDDEDE